MTGPGRLRFRLVAWALVVSILTSACAARNKEYLLELDQ